MTLIRKDAGQIQLYHLSSGFVQGDIRSYRLNSVRIQMFVRQDDVVPNLI